MKNGTIVSLIVIAAIVAVVTFAGCVETSSYSVEYSAVAKGHYGMLNVKLSGPAEDLAIMLTNPEGETDIEYISKKEMIDNFQSVEVRMCESGSPPAGTYRLNIKTITPEKVVYKENLKFGGANVEIEDAEFETQTSTAAYGTRPAMYGITYIKITVRNDGDLPIIFDEASIIAEGIELFGGPIRVSQGVSPGESNVIILSPSGWRDRCLTGGIHPVTLELYSDKSKVASFVKQVAFKSYWE